MNNSVVPLGILPGALTPVLIAKFSLFVALLLLWVVVLGKIGKKLLHLPTIATQIIAGIVLGPSAMNIAGWALFSDTIELSSSYALASTDLFIAVILIISSAWTVSYLLWIAGHETDVSDIYRIGFTAVIAGFLGAVFPIIMTVGGMYSMFSTSWTLAQQVGLGLAFAATSVSIPVAMLIASDKMHLKSSKATLGAAIIDDILAVIFLSLYFIAVEAGFFGCGSGISGCAGHGTSLLVSLIYMMLTFVCIGLVGIWVKPAVLAWLNARRLTHLVAPFAQISMQLHFAFAELFGGLAGITGAYFAGLFHKQGDVSHSAQQVFAPYVHAVLLPLFLGSIGLQIDVRILHATDWILVGLLLGIAIFSKMIGCWVSTLMARGLGAQWSALETYLFGASMVARGEVGLVIASVLYSAKIFVLQQYVVAIVVIVLSTVAAPILLAIGFYRLRVDHDTSHPYELTFGPFPTIGTAQVFDIIMNQLESAGIYKTVIEMSEGKRVINIEGQHVEIIVNPATGITFSGDRDTVGRIIRMVKEALMDDIAQLQTR